MKASAMSSVTNSIWRVRLGPRKSKNSPRGIPALPVADPGHLVPVVVPDDRDVLLLPAAVGELVHANAAPASSLPLEARFDRSMDDAEHRLSTQPEVAGDGRQRRLFALSEYLVLHRAGQPCSLPCPRHGLDADPATAAIDPTQSSHDVRRLAPPVEVSPHPVLVRQVVMLPAGRAALASDHQSARGLHPHERGSPSRTRPLPPIRELPALRGHALFEHLLQAHRSPPSSSRPGTRRSEVDRCASHFHPWVSTPRRSVEAQTAGRAASVLRSLGVRWRAGVPNPALSHEGTKSRILGKRRTVPSPARLLLARWRESRIAGRASPRTESRDL